MILEILKTRFHKNMALHSGLEWTDVEKRLLADPKSLGILRRMEESGGEPDTIGFDGETGKLIFCDCAKESPSGRRSLCYDDEALKKRAKNPPAGSAAVQIRVFRDLSDRIRLIRQRRERLYPDGRSADTLYQRQPRIRDPAERQRRRRTVCPSAVHGLL